MEGRAAISAICAISKEGIVGATVSVQEGNGAVIAYNTITNGRFCCSDAYNPGLNTPIPIPSGGVGNYARSWWKHWSLNISGTFTQVNNIKVFCDGTIGWNFGTGGKVQVGIRDAGDNGCPEGSYERAAGSASTGYDIDDGTNGHDYYKAQTATPADIESYTNGAELTLDSSTYTSADNTDSLVAQLLIDGDSTLGAQNTETITYEYDEI